MRPDPPPPRFAALLAALSIFALSASTAAEAAPKRSGTVRAIQATEEIPESELLDIGIRVFDPGLPVIADPFVLAAELEEKGIFPEVRRAEARYVPVRLMDTLQSTGFWGAVRVVPTGVTTDVTITGRIVDSSGRGLELAVRAYDATGRVWLDKTYKRLADPRAYADNPLASVRDPFDSLYNEIANDLLAARQKRGADTQEIRRVSRLEFAADLIPEAFDDYLRVDRRGRTTAARLPAEGDPMLERVSGMRQRDLLFIDTLTEHYIAFYARMSEAYDNWRRFSYEEELALKKLKRKARGRKIFGALGILGGLIAESSGDSVGSGIGDLAVLGGVMAIQSGINKGREAKIHRESLNELGASLDGEVEALVVEIDGETHRLTGTVEAQYAAWRELLRRLFAAETGEEAG